VTDELVDVVDEDDRVLRTVPRSTMRAENLRHRAVFVLVRSSSRRVLVHRRSERKDVWPGWWDLAVGGVVAAGETYDDAVRRELAEELGLVAADPVPVGGGRYADDHVDLIARIYHLHHDGPFRFVDGEVAEARFVTLDELRAHLAAVPYLPDSIALVLPHV
jgi:isopentenyldiphosphate isomerase